MADTLSRAEYARLLGIQDLARLVVAAHDNGYPLADGSWEPDLIERLRTALALIEERDSGTEERP